MLILILLSKNKFLLFYRKQKNQRTKAVSALSHIHDTKKKEDTKHSFFFSKIKTGQSLLLFCGCAESFLHKLLL